MAAGDVSYGAALAVRKKGNCRHLMRLRIPDGVDAPTRRHRDVPRWY